MPTSSEKKMKIVMALIPTVGILVLAASASVAVRAASPGTLDPSFATGGILTWDLADQCIGGGPSNDYAAAIAMNSDGASPIIGGRSLSASCYLATGLKVSSPGIPSLEFRFYEENYSLTTPNTINALINYQNQTLVLAGEAYSMSAGIDQAYVWSYVSDVSARIQLPVSGAYSTINGIAADSAGGIFVVGSYRTTTGTTRAFIAKLNADLSANGTFGGFGNHGVVSYATSLSMTDEFDEFTAVAIDEQGRPVVVGRTGNLPCSSCQPNYDFLVVRYQTNGTIDTNFGEAGVGADIIDFAGDDHYQGSDVDGNYYSCSQYPAYCFLLRQDDRATAIAIDGQQRIVVAGYSERFITADGTPPSQGGVVIWDGANYALIRLQPDGGFDSTVALDNHGVGVLFNGEELTSYGAHYTGTALAWGSSGELNAGATGVVIDRDDAIDIVGTVTVGNRLNDVGLARFTMFPSLYGFYLGLDSGFNATGLLQLHLEQNFGEPADTQATALALDRQGRLLVAGFTNQNDENESTGYDFLVARVLSDGIFRDGFDAAANPLP